MLKKEQQQLDFKKVVLEITDTGIEISEFDCQRIFEKFYRVDKSRSKKMGETRLGLSIVKHSVQLYKGSIHVNSKLGKGTIMRIVFPI